MACGQIKNANMGEPNYATVQVYASLEDMQNGSIWDTLDYSTVGGRADLGERTWPYVKSAGSDIIRLSINIGRLIQGAWISGKSIWAI